MSTNTLADLPEVMTVREAADYLRCHPDAVYRLIRVGDLPAIRLGRHLKVHRDRLAAFVGAEPHTVDDHASNA
ncbi:MAG: helix-turn-helix domain-containing protein [Actinomycetota bacterium]|nr:helix-turn-helix domain-containing protein [Actinomycetota bacterium]